MIQLAIFASGTGTNAQQIIRHFERHPGISVGLVVSNKPGAGVIEVANKAHVPVLVLDKDRFFNGDAYAGELQLRGIDFIILAGFLWKIPARLINAFPNRIINIHPALLPGYGGKGMYGRFVHEAVIAAGEKETGISIHFVDELYDHGNIIFQARCAVSENDDADSLAKKVHALEHLHYPAVIEKTVQLQNPG